MLVLLFASIIVISIHHFFWLLIFSPEFCFCTDLGLIFSLEICFCTNLGFCPSVLLWYSLELAYALLLMVCFCTGVLRLHSDSASRINLAFFFMVGFQVLLLPWSSPYHSQVQFVNIRTEALFERPWAFAGLLSNFEHIRQHFNFVFCGFATSTSFLAPTVARLVQLLKILSSYNSKSLNRLGAKTYSMIHCTCSHYIERNKKAVQTLHWKKKKAIDT